MNSIQSILVHLDGTARAAVRLRIAHQLATTHSATLTALFAVAPHIVPLSLPLGDGVPIAPLLAEVDPKHRAHAKALYERSVAKGAPASTWHELSGEPPIQGFVERALLADLLVLGQRDPADAKGFDVPAGFVESVILDSGRPALVVPHAGEASAEPGTVLVAWKPTRESAHAVTAALPLLRGAKHVHVVCSAASSIDTQQALSQVGQYLSAHGIASVREHFGVASSDVGSGLLSLAAEVGAELLVMGCYGHSRARELVLGGASRTVLQSMTVPVLMAH
jgi:nucleotide-binding universal stress UspA family protein